MCAQMKEVFIKHKSCRDPGIFRSDSIDFSGCSFGALEQAVPDSIRLAGTAVSGEPLMMEEAPAEMEIIMEAASMKLVSAVELTQDFNTGKSKISAAR